MRISTFPATFDLSRIPLVYLHSSGHRTCSLVVEKAVENRQQIQIAPRYTLGNGKPDGGLADTP